MLIEEVIKMTPWNELSELEQAQCIFSDMFKDAYGFRPRHIDFSTWTLEQFQAEFKELGSIIQSHNEEE